MAAGDPGGEPDDVHQQGHSEPRGPAGALMAFVVTHSGACPDRRYRRYRLQARSWEVGNDGVEFTVSLGRLRGRQARIKLVVINAALGEGLLEDAAHPVSITVRRSHLRVRCHPPTVSGRRRPADALDATPTEMAESG